MKIHPRKLQCTWPQNQSCDLRSPACWSMWLLQRNWIIVSWWDSEQFCFYNLMYVYLLAPPSRPLGEHSSPRKQTCIPDIDRTVSWCWGDEVDRWEQVSWKNDKQLIGRLPSGLYPPSCAYSEAPSYEPWYSLAPGRTPRRRPTRRCWRNIYIYIYLQWDFCLNVYATPSSASSNFSTSGRRRFGGGTGMAEVGMVIEERRNDEHRWEIVLRYLDLSIVVISIYF